MHQVFSQANFFMYRMGIKQFEKQMPLTIARNSPKNMSHPESQLRRGESTPPCRTTTAEGETSQTSSKLQYACFPRTESQLQPGHLFLIAPVNEFGERKPWLYSDSDLFGRVVVEVGKMPSTVRCHPVFQV